ncbi:MAG: dTMP kinase [Chloroflexi bacterium RBG_13_46_14]|nr:MAG: dTMP kinase [Chloroflexi bacterium RBG_13_46_14]
MSLFITFEGEEGSGKSYQAEELRKWLSAREIPVILTHEPGGTELGEKISDLVKWSYETDISPLTELLLFNASRAQHVKEVIYPALNEGKVVVCDRFDDSTTAYQSFGRGLNLELVKKINTAATGGLRPDLTILLDISIGDGLARKSGEKLDRFEQEDRDFHRKVREGYLKLANEEPERWLVIDGMQTREKISGIIRDRVRILLN